MSSYNALWSVLDFSASADSVEFPADATDDLDDRCDQQRDEAIAHLDAETKS